MTNPSNKIVLTKEQIDEVEDLAAYFTVDEVADYLGVSHKCFQAIRKRQEDVLFSYKKGRARKIKAVVEKLFAKIENADSSGDVACIIFFLKTQALWKETKEVEVVKTIFHKTPKELEEDEKEARLFLEFKEQRKNAVK